LQRKENTRLSLLLRSIGHRVKPRRITPAAGNERGDIEIKDYVILPHGEDDRLPPRTLVMDVTMTHDHYGRPLSVPTEPSHTEYPPPVLLSLMVPSTRQVD
jgi:hypothetical protein